MGKRILTALLVCAAVLLLCACNLYYKDYESVQDYIPAAQETESTDKVSVRNISALKNALLGIAYAGEADGTIVFDQSYEGDPAEDIASACWQVRTQDALCAYCVENISYELRRIVTISEANVHISYSEKNPSAEEIVQLSYSSGIQKLIKQALTDRSRRLVVLIGRSTYSAVGMESEVVNVYRQNPTITLREPVVNVTMFSGTGAQRLYEIEINYGMTAEEMEQRMAQLSAVDAFADTDTETMTEAERAYIACKYLVENCTLSEQPTDNTAYAALVGKSANSEGIAFAYVQLCKQLKVDCRIVYGQRFWSDYCWNIVKLGDDCYHVDAAAAIVNGMESSFLLGDEVFWGAYRWDVASYPKCLGELRYADIVPPVQSGEEIQMEETVEIPVLPEDGEFANSVN